MCYQNTDRVTLNSTEVEIFGFRTLPLDIYTLNNSKSRQLHQPIPILTQPSLGYSSVTEM
jgi:hypothetical protein